MLSKRNEEKMSRGDKLPTYEIAKRLKLNYIYVIRRVRLGRIPSEYINGEYLVSLKDAEDYFSIEHEDEGKRDMNGKLSAATVAKKYGVSYKSIRKKLKIGEIPSVKQGGYYYIDPKDAEEYFGKL